MKRTFAALLACGVFGCREKASEKKGPIQADPPDTALAAVDSMVSMGDAVDEADPFGIAALEDAALPDAPSFPPSDITLDPPDTTVRLNRWRFRVCHTRALSTDPTAAGKVVVTLRVNAEGEVMSSATTSTTAPTALADCVTEAFRRMKFPEPDSGVKNLEIAVTLALKK